jgi:hypothetical protein
MKRRHFIIAVFAFSCASATRPPERSADRLTSYSGTNCVEMVLIRSVSPEALQAIVPARYRIAPGTAGTGQLAFAIYTCDLLTLDASPAGRGVVAEISARIQSPDGSEGRHAYLLHHLTSLKPLSDALGRFGDVFRFAPDASFAVGQRAPGADNVARARIESDQVAFSSVGDPVKEPAEGPVVYDGKGVTFWLDNGRERIKLEYRAPKLLPRSTGTITTKITRIDAALAKFGDTASGTGAFLRFDAKVLVTVMPP